MPIAVTNIEKNGPVIVCTTDDSQNRTYKLDFQNAKVYGLTGKPLSSTRAIVTRIPEELARNNVLFYALYVFKDSFYCENASYYSIVESLLSYPELISTRIDVGMIRYLKAEYDGSLPKGYVAWCRKENVKFSFSTLKDFLADRILCQWPQSLVDTLNKFYEGTGVDLAEETDYDKELCVSLMRIVHNSLKRYEIRGLFSNIQSILSIVNSNPQFRPFLDDTKNAKTALQILESAVQEERNKKILANEARIADLDGVVVNNFVIKVPSTMEDFTDEGEQQHNCVGYYYHEAIARGNTLIYFLRRAKNPDKSYVTCRYWIDKKETVEHRLKNNEWYINDSAFEKIDKMIADILGL